jgi:hypothetical protein
MGILNDAIREHLELKRKHGAESSDLERMEKEAFGPPSRPGDPDFDEPEAGGDDALHSAETTIAPAVGGDDEPSAKEHRLDWLEELEDEGDDELEDEPELQYSDAEDAGLDEGEDEEEEELFEGGGETDAGVDPQDTVDYPALEIEEEDQEGAEGFGAAGGRGEEPLEAEIFDREDEVSLDLDLDLGIDEGEEPLEPEPESARQGTPSGLEPEGARDEDDEQGFPDDGEEEDRPAAARTPDDEQDADEDLLEETPDFLQDTPEGERLWFEQNPPRDFDFDE